MESLLLEKDAFTAEYRFAKDLVITVFEMQAFDGPGFSLLQLESLSLTIEQKAEFKELFPKDFPQLDKLVKRFTGKFGQSNYGDRQFLFCVKQSMEEYKPELKSEEEFLLVCSNIAYVTACFLEKNDQSDALNVATDRVCELLIDTLYTTKLDENELLMKDILNRKYRFAYDLIKILVEIRGITVPEAELPNADICLFTSDHKSYVKNYIKNRGLSVEDHNYRDIRINEDDDNFSRFINNFVENNEFEKNTVNKFLQKCVDIAYAASWDRNKNSKPNSLVHALDFIHQMVKKTVDFNMYDRHNDYRFSCDLVKAIIEMEYQYFTPSEIYNYNNKSFIILDKNQIEEFLSTEKSFLDQTVKKLIKKGKKMHYNDQQFQSYIDHFLDGYKPQYILEDLIDSFARIAYVSACFLRKNSKSNAPRLALERMRKIVNDIIRLPESRDRNVIFMRTQDNCLYFAYDLVNAVLKMKNVPELDLHLPAPDIFLFTDAHRHNIKVLLSKQSSKLDETVEKLTKIDGISDYSNNAFLQRIQEINNIPLYDGRAEDALLFRCAIIAYASVCFYRKNRQSSAPILAVNNIYRMIKNKLISCRPKVKNASIVKVNDDHYRFAYDLTKMVLEVKGIPVCRVDLPSSENLLFTNTYQKQIRDFLSRDWFRLNGMVEKLVRDTGCLDYSDSKFVHFMNQIVEDNQPVQENECVCLWARIAFTASVFLEKNCRSNSAFMAVNRIYEMSKHVLCKNTKEAIVEDDYQFALDLVLAALRIGNKTSFIIDMTDSGDSPLTIQHRNEIQDFLAKEWPFLNQLVRRFSKTYTAFSNGHFVNCMNQIIKDNASEQKTEKALLLTSARIAYVAHYFLRKNKKSNAADLALDCIYQMRKEFTQQSKANSSIIDANDEVYHFALYLVKAVTESQLDSPVHYNKQLPKPKNVLFTTLFGKKTEMLIKKVSESIDKLIEKLTSKNGNLDCSDATFQRLIDQIIKENKHEQVSMDGLERLFVRLAYPAYYFTAKDATSNSLSLAVQRIHEIARNTIYFNKIKSKNESFCV